MAWLVSQAYAWLNHLTTSSSQRHISTLSDEDPRVAGSQGRDSVPRFRAVSRSCRCHSRRSSGAGTTGAAEAQARERQDRHSGDVVAFGHRLSPIFRRAGLGRCDGLRITVLV